MSEPTYSEISDDDAALLASIAPFTMTSLQRQYNLLKALRYIDAHNISGDIVECGVWRGGSIMLAKLARTNSPIARRYHLFDTFAGMTEPDGRDISYEGEQAGPTFHARKKDGYNGWCFASLEEVKDNFARRGLLDEDVVFCKGDVIQTLDIEANLPDRIAILRLDTDWYASTRKELDVLYPRISPKGVLIVDDYGYWEGARRAVDEYFGDKPPLLIAVDHTGRFAIKV